MIFRRILGVIIIIVGIVMIFVSLHIEREIVQGKGKISSAQRQVDTGKGFFDLFPGTKPIGKELTRSAQEQIDQGKRDIVYYQKLSERLFYGGIVLIVLGILLLFLRRRKKASK